jgi:hypothetical protein
LHALHTVYYILEIQLVGYLHSRVIGSKGGGGGVGGGGTRSYVMLEQS